MGSISTDDGYDNDLDDWGGWYTYVHIKPPNQNQIHEKKRNEKK